MQPKVYRLIIKLWLTSLDMAQSRTSTFKSPRLLWTSASLAFASFLESGMPLLFPQRTSSAPPTRAHQLWLWSHDYMKRVPHIISFIACIDSLLNNSPRPFRPAQDSSWRNFRFCVAISVQMKGKKRPLNASKWGHGGPKWRCNWLADCVQVP